METQSLNMKENDENVGAPGEVDEINRVEEEKDDLLDKNPTVTPKPFFTKLEFVWCIAGILFFYGDGFTDIYLVWQYILQKHYVYFSVTLLFVILPAVLINILSMMWYWSDESEGSKEVEVPDVSTELDVSEVPKNTKVSKRFDVFKNLKVTCNLRIIFHFLLLGPVWRLFDRLHFGYTCTSWSDSRKEKYRIMHADGSLLKLLEAFLESAPQFILQLYILITVSQVSRHNDESDELDSKETDSTNLLRQVLENPQILVSYQAICICIALVSPPLSQTLYKQSNRKCQSDKKHMNYIGIFFCFAWHLFIFGARVLALSLFATIFISGFPAALIVFPIIIIIRVIVMIVWLKILQEISLQNRWSQLYYQILFGFVHLFTYVNLSDEPTLKKYVRYYTYEYIENVILIVCWACFVSQNDTYCDKKIFWIALSSYIGGSVLGLICMLIYYTRFHPNGPRHDLVALCYRLPTDL